MKKIVIDLDNTITNGFGDYETIPPNSDVVRKMYDYKELGFCIVIYTARNMRTYKESIGLINKFTLPKIINWLEKNGIPYDELIVGKPWCGTEGFYVDDRAVRPDEFINQSYDELKEKLGM